MVDLALKILLHDKLRFTITVAGVANCEVEDTNLVFEQAGVQKFTVNATKYLGKTY